MAPEKSPNFLARTSNATQIGDSSGVRSNAWDISTNRLLRWSKGILYDTNANCMRTDLRLDFEH